MGYWATLHYYPSHRRKKAARRWYTNACGSFCVPKVAPKMHRFFDPLLKNPFLRGFQWVFSPFFTSPKPDSLRKWNIALHLWRVLYESRTRCIEFSSKWSIICTPLASFCYFRPKVLDIVLPFSRFDFGYGWRFHIKSIYRFLLSWCWVNNTWYNVKYCLHLLREPLIA